ncbi:MAG: ArsR family transcriptional regulator [Deltaproteobacteria bacterium]|nr:ArsR family transcriptional regulator [Deltaproteobacteria bacterium]
MAAIVKKEENEKLLQARQSFIEGAGRISASLLGILNRVCGQIYALLFLSPEPLSLDDIVAELGVSKGNVSVNIRVLEDYKLVKKVWVKGTRKDYYQAVDTLPTKIIKEFFEKIRRNIRDSLDMIDDCCATVDGAKGVESEAQFMLERLKRIQSFYKNANFLFEAIYSGQKIDTSVLKTVIEG